MLQTGYFWWFKASVWFIPHSSFRSHRHGKGPDVPLWPSATLPVLLCGVHAPAELWVILMVHLRSDPSQPQWRLFSSIICVGRTEQQLRIIKQPLTLRASSGTYLQCRPPPLSLVSVSQWPFFWISFNNIWDFNKFRIKQTISSWGNASAGIFSWSTPTDFTLCYWPHRYFLVC